MITRKARRKSTNLSLIVPALGQWCSATLLANPQLKPDPSIERFCNEATTMGGFLTPEQIVACCCTFNRVP